MTVQTLSFQRLSLYLNVDFQTNDLSTRWYHTVVWSTKSGSFFFWIGVKYCCLYHKWHATISVASISFFSSTSLLTIFFVCATPFHSHFRGLTMVGLDGSLPTAIVTKKHPNISRPSNNHIYSGYDDQIVKQMFPKHTHEQFKPLVLEWYFDCDTQYVQLVPSGDLPTQKQEVLRQRDCARSVLFHNKVSCTLFFVERRLDPLW